MKEYLKMADAFDCELLIDCDCDDAIVDKQSFVVLESFDGSDVAKYAAHAINSHDELVAEVAKLTDLCERFSIFCEDVGEFMGSGRNANSVRNEYIEHKLSKAP